MTNVIELPPMAASPLYPNSEDWLKALKAINAHQEHLSRKRINDCLLRHGHRKCCCVCGDTTTPMVVGYQTKSPLFSLVCLDCFAIQKHEFHVQWYHSRELTQDEDDFLMSEASRRFDA